MKAVDLVLAVIYSSAGVLFIVRAVMQWQEILK